MNLIFHDASSVPLVPTGEAVLTIEQKGTLSLSTAAVAQLGLAPDSTLIPVQDTDTNAWYLLLSPPAPHRAFRLRRRDKTSKALIFCSTPRARAYYAAHGLSEQKSVRTLVAATAIEAQGLRLYPLTPQHPTLAPTPVATTLAVPAEEPATLAAASTEVPLEEATIPVEEPAAAKPVSKYTPEQDAELLDPANSPSELARKWGVSSAALHSRRSMLKRQAGEVLPSAAPPAPTAPTLVYTPAPGTAPVQKTFGLQARAEELASYWLERDMNRTTPNELAEILNLLRHVPASKRGVEMTLVLERAETEHTHRLTAAGKGGNRG